jgi:periplasmic protein TonB
MSMSTLSWHDDGNPRELARWAVAAAVVVGVHGGVLAYLLAVHEPDIVGSNMDVVTVELAPIDSTPDAVEQDVAPAPETMFESSPLPDLPKPQEQPKEEVKLERPPDEAPAEVPLPVEKPPEKVQNSPPPAPVTAPGQGRRAERGAVMADEPDVATAAFQALSGHSTIAEGGRRRAVEFQPRPLWSCSRP